VKLDVQTSNGLTRHEDVHGNLPRATRDVKLVDVVCSVVVVN